MKLFHIHHWTYKGNLRSCRCGKIQFGALINMGREKIYIDKIKSKS